MNGARIKRICAGWLTLFAAACERREPPQVTGERQLRVNAPPQGVRALPPHAIRRDGVGPYRLGVPLEQLGTEVPSGAQNAQVDIPHVVHLNVLHAEDDAILVGAMTPVGRASFVSVVRGDIARTASGIHVGSTQSELIRALGAPVADLDRAGDPRIIVPETMRELRALVAESGRVVGLVVAPAEPVAKLVSACARPAPDAVNAVAVRAASGAGERSARPLEKRGACFSGVPDVLVVQGEQLSVYPLDGGRPISVANVPNLVWAAPIRNRDGRDDLVAIRRADESQTRTWFVHLYRIQSRSRVVKVSDKLGDKLSDKVTDKLIDKVTDKLIDGAPVYQLTAGNARWLGSELDDLDVALEVTSRNDVIEMGGLLIVRRKDRLRNLVVLSAVQVPVGRTKAVGAESGDSESSRAHTTGAQTHPKVIGK